MESAGKAEYDRLIAEMRAGMAPPESGQQIVPLTTRGRWTAFLAIAASVAIAAAIFAPGEHATYWASLGHVLEFLAGGCILFTFGAYGKWRRAAVARNLARQRR